VGGIGDVLEITATDAARTNASERQINIFIVGSSRRSPGTLHAMCFVPISSEGENGFVTDSGRASRAAVRAKMKAPSTAAGASVHGRRGKGHFTNPRTYGNARSAPVFPDLSMLSSSARPAKKSKGDPAGQRRGVL
jgi:hypothetical protein